MDAELCGVSYESFNVVITSRGIPGDIPHTCPVIIGDCAVLFTKLLSASES